MDTERISTGVKRRPASRSRRALLADDAAREGGRYLGWVSENAKTMFRTIAERYRAAGHPDRQTHYFDVGATTDTLRELETAGLIQRVFGIPGGVGWRLTEAGVEEVKQQS